MAQTTQQPSVPYHEGEKWFFTYYTLDGPRKIGPFPDEQTARDESWKAVRIHEANGYTDGNINIID